MEHLEKLQDEREAAHEAHGFLSNQTQSQLRVMNETFIKIVKGDKSLIQGVLPLVL